MSQAISSLDNASLVISRNPLAAISRASGLFFVANTRACAKTIGMWEIIAAALSCSSAVVKIGFAPTNSIISIRGSIVLFLSCLVALINKKKYKTPIVPTKSLKFVDAVIWICFGMGICVIANAATSYLVAFLKTVGITLTQGDVSNPNSVFECVLNIIGIAIVPAICEEFAMRCCSLGLLKNYGKAFGVVAVSVVFGLLHGNVIQFVFAFLVGLVLAYVTIKTDSIIPAMCIHALNNGMSAVSDTVNFIAGKEINITAALFGFWLLLGVIATVYLGIKHKLTLPKENSDCVLTTGEKISSFLFPGMIIPFLLLIVMTAQTVKIG